jgi:hypothetical protein|tara:strand:- start:13340 stop:13522 length:183 start_codon:yes stop_codon:yes gene_type:complete
MEGAKTVDFDWDTRGIPHLFMDRKCLCFREKNAESSPGIACVPRGEQEYLVNTEILLVLR